MAKVDELALLAMVKFDREYLRPAATLYGASGDVGSLYSLAELLEGYFWLALGVTLEVFPISEARLLVRQRFAHAFQEFPRFFKAWGYLLDNQLVTLIENAINQNEFFKKTSLAEFEYPEHLRSTFQSIVLLQTRFCRLSEVRNLLAIMNFEPRVLFSLLQQDRSRRPQALLGGHFNGFLRAVEYMGDCREFYTSLLENQHIEERDRFLFQRRARQLQTWRLNFGLSTNKVLFTQLIDRIPEFMPVDAVRRGISLDLADMKHRIEDLMTDWGLQLALGSRY